MSVVVGDIGGTNCRLALWRNGGLQTVQKLPTDLQLTQNILGFVGALPEMPDALVLAGGGVSKGETLQLTNADAQIDLAALRGGLSGVQPVILNDFEAAASALRAPPTDDFLWLQGREFTDGPRLIAGVGTGLGSGVWTGQHALATEGGHITTYPLNKLEQEMFDVLAHIWPEVATGLGSGVETEAVVSGISLPKVYRAYCSVLSCDPIAASAKEVIERGKNGGDAAARASIETLSLHLGVACGDLFLSSWAKGGVVLAGGVLQKNSWLLEHGFWSGFHAGGRYEAARRSVPVAIWKSDDIGLIGAGLWADSRV